MATTPPPTTSRAVARARSRAAWADLRDRLATVTPAALGRAILAVAVVGAMVGMTAITWPALLPFAAGGLLAYAILPLVDSLDRILPRSVAAIVALLVALGVVVGALVVVVPPLTRAVIALASSIPPPAEIESELGDILAGLPASTRDVIEPVVLAVAGIVRDTLDGASGGIRDVVGAVLQAAVGVAGAILGLVVLPAWMLTVMTSNRRGRVALDRRLAGWLRADFWAVVRMLDRAAGTYLRGYVVVAFLVGLLTWLGLTLSPQVGGPEFPSALAIATFAGMVQVIPELGPLLGLLPAILALATAPEVALPYIAIYLVARFVGAGVLGGRMMDDRLNVPRAVLIPGVVVLSQIGPLALLLSGPILAFGTDLVRYLHGRLSEPPRPAGILPGQPVPAAAAATGTAARVPFAYRHGPSPTPAATPTTPRPTAPTAAGAAATPSPTVSR